MIAAFIIMILTHKTILYTISLHIWSLLYAWTKVFLFYGEHLLDWYYLSWFKELFYLCLISHVLVLKMDVIPDVVRSQGVICLFVLDPSIVHERIFEKLLELTSEFHNFGFWASIIQSECNLEACFTSTLPQVLAIFLCLGMVKFTETS